MNQTLEKAIKTGAIIAASILIADIIRRSLGINTEGHMTVLQTKKDK